MPTATVLKSTVTRRQAADPVDQAERLLQAAYHEAAENAATTEQERSAAAPEPAPAQDRGPAPELEGSPAAETEKPRKQRKWEEQREAHAVQAAFLAGNLGKPVTVFTINGLRLTGKLRQFDQYCLLLEGRDGIPSLVFKRAVTTVALASASPGKQRQP